MLYINFNFYTSWRWQASFTHRPLELPDTHWTERLAPLPVWTFWKKDNFLASARFVRSLRWLSYTPNGSIPCWMFYLPAYSFYTHCPTLCRFTCSPTSFYPQPLLATQNVSQLYTWYTSCMSEIVAAQAMLIWLLSAWVLLPLRDSRTWRTNESVQDYYSKTYRNLINCLFTYGLPTDTGSNIYYRVTAK